jgi:endonuclease/exonuclease/phosphatase family metal-dependent hydrolase
LELFLKDELSKWDVVTFQELFGSYSPRRHKFLKKARKMGFLYQVHSPHPGPFSGHLVDGGLVIVSRYPIIAHDFHMYKEGAAADALSAKGVLYAKIQYTPDISVHFFTTHLQASYASREKDRVKFEQIRSIQLLELQEFANSKTAHDCDPIILTGDMNTNMTLKSGGGPPALEYVNMMNTLSSKYFIPLDVLYHLYGHHPVTGFSEEIAKLHATTEAVQCCPDVWRSLDYVLVLARKTYNNLQTFKVIDLTQTESTRVEKPETSDDHLITSRKGTKSINVTTMRGFEVKIEGSVEFFRPPPGSEFTTLSDHYGVSVTFHIRSDGALPPCPLSLSK